MKADFSGYATKVGLKCSDGRTIMAHAFAKQDKATVPLVWQHVHSDVKNVLGHAVLENREDGVYAHAFFNDTDSAQHAKKLVVHGDIVAMSIYANQLIEQSKQVIHGVIREVSLVLSGANPGALIDHIAITHGDGGTEELEDEAIIFTGLEFTHAADDDEPDNDEEADEASDEDEDNDTVEEIYQSMNAKQKKLVAFMLGEVAGGANADLKQSDIENDDVVDESSDSEDDSEEITHDSDDDSSDENTEVKHGAADNLEGSTMNVFEKNGETDGEGAALSHDALIGIVKDAKRSGSLRDAFEGYALQHNINDIDLLFPDAQAVETVPEFLKRRTEWVGELMSGVRKSPFSRIKTLSADLTMEEARAKGYVTGTLKKEEFFAVSRRVTTPTTIYKKQKLDRDDMVDITDFDVVVWLKGEMRVMLDEEIARAILLGDGRDVSSEDKINELNIRPIATDHEMYTTQVNVNIDDANSSMNEVLDAIIRNRRYLRGTGQPVMYTSESYISRFMLIRDGDGRRMYKNLGEIAAELRVAKIVPVEVMEEYDNIVAILVNPSDYVVGADKNGKVSMFDDFDIDYNQYKYLIETRMSGALTRLKSAMCIRKVAATAVVVVPAEPAFVPATGALTITDQTGVAYTNQDGTVLTAIGSPYTVPSGTTWTVTATPTAGYYFESGEEDTWTFTSE